MAYVALRDLGPCTLFHYKHLYFCLLCFATPALGILPLSLGNSWPFQILPLLLKAYSFSSSSFYQGQKLHQMWMTEELAMLSNLWREGTFMGVGGWGRKPLMETSPNIWRAGKWKNAVTQEQKLWVEEEKSGEKSEIAKRWENSSKTYSPKRLLIKKIFLLTFLRI